MCRRPLAQQRGRPRKGPWVHLHQESGALLQGMMRMRMMIPSQAVTLTPTPLSRPHRPPPPHPHRPSTMMTIITTLEIMLMIKAMRLATILAMAAASIVWVIPWESRVMRRGHSLEASVAVLETSAAASQLVALGWWGRPLYRQLRAQCDDPAAWSHWAKIRAPSSAAEPLRREMGSDLVDTHEAPTRPAEQPPLPRQAPPLLGSLWAQQGHPLKDCEFRDSRGRRGSTADASPSTWTTSSALMPRPWRPSP